MNLKKIKDDVIKSLIKKAKGYCYNEECSEFSYSDDGEKLNKKKITTKIVPPDLSALKGAMELLKQQDDEIERLTDEELNENINTLIKKLKIKSKTY